MMDRQIATIADKPQATSEFPKITLGKELQQQNKLEQAEQCFRAVIASHPRCWQAYEALAQLLNSLGKTQAAIDVYLLGAENNPDQPQYLLAVGKLLSEQKKWQAAHQYFQKALKNEPATPWGYLHWAKVLVELNRWQHAQNVTIKAIKFKSDLWQAHHHLGEIFQHRQLWQPAIAAYRKAVTLRPNLIHCYLQIAKIHLQLEQPQEAIWAYKHLISHAKPESPLQYQAIELYLQQLLANPLSTAQDYQELGDLCLTKGCLTQAITAYQHCVLDYGADYLPEDSDKTSISPEAIAFCFQQLENYAQATAKDYCELGNICRNHGYFSEAISACQAAIKLDPQWELPYIRLQYTKAAARDNQQLINFYRQLLAKEQNLPLAWGGLGDALSQQGQVGEALGCYRTSCYQRVTKIAPELTKLDWDRPKQKNPDFIIFGSAKCGTTALYSYLSQHSQMLLPHKKELDFFWQNYDRGMAWYLAHFPAITDREDFFTGEATPNYIRFPHVVNRIKTHCPESKLIVLLRNPVDRAISWHHHKVKAGLAKGSLEEAIAIELKQLATSNETELAKGGYRKIDNIYSSLYYYQLQPWLANFPKKQFLFLKSEDFYRDTAKVMEQVFNFIGVESQQLAQYSTVNKGSYNKVDNNIRQQLQEYFAPHNQKLEDLLDIEFNWG